MALCLYLVGWLVAVIGRTTTNEIKYSQRCKKCIKTNAKKMWSSAVGAFVVFIALSGAVTRKNTRKKAANK